MESSSAEVERDPRSGRTRLSQRDISSKPDHALTPCQRSNISCPLCALRKIISVGVQKSAAASASGRTSDSYPKHGRP
jgi:hypothetical protein